MLDDRSSLGSVLFANRESSSMPSASSSMPFDCRFALIGGGPATDWALADRLQLAKANTPVRTENE